MHRRFTPADLFIVFPGAISRCDNHRDPDTISHSVSEVATHELHISLNPHVRRKRPLIHLNRRLEPSAHYLPFAMPSRTRIPIRAGTMIAIDSAHVVSPVRAVPAAPIITTKPPQNVLVFNSLPNILNLLELRQRF